MYVVVCTCTTDRVVPIVVEYKAPSNLYVHTMNNNIVLFTLYSYGYSLDSRFWKTYRSIRIPYFVTP